MAELSKLHKELFGNEVYRIKKTTAVFSFNMVVINHETKTIIKSETLSVAKGTQIQLNEPEIFTFQGNEVLVILLTPFATEDCEVKDGYQLAFVQNPDTAWEDYYRKFDN